jgi:Flp pilus assembly protein TadG
MIERIRHFSKQSRAQRGQIIIFIAVVAVSMLGMIGMAVDLGYTFAEKRTVQNAADAAASAGTRVVTQWSTTNNLITAQSDVAKIVAANNMGDATQTFSCYYVDDKGKKLDSCGKTVPETATGVTVSVSETHKTFFLRAIPGAPRTVTTSATATAHAQIVTPDGSGAPFILCGSSAKLLNGHGTMPIVTLQPDGTYAINQSAVNQTFVIHASQVEGCGLQPNRYKGLALGSSNKGKTVPDWFYGDDGNRVGQANQVVNGIQGCGTQATDPFSCVMFVPLATDTPPAVKNGSENLFYVVAYAAFTVSSCNSPCQDQATLLSTYIIDTPVDMPAWVRGTWKRGDNGIIAIRLTQ